MDMDSSDNEEIYDKLYTDIRASLNIDNETLDDAWDSYRRINNHFALEVISRISYNSFLID